MIASDGQPRDPAAAAIGRVRDLLERANRQDGPVVQTPSMINHQEQQLLYLLAAEYHGNRGAIVDAGVFLGASTRCLAAGLRANPGHRPGGEPRIRSLDLCLCDDYMAGLINEAHGASLRAGDSFEPFLRDSVADLGGEVDLRVGDIRAERPAGIIEILFLDVCKDPAVNAHVVGTFFPRLIPGVSVVVHQDFVHESLPWIHVSMGVLADYFTLVGVVGDFGLSAVYLCTKAIPDTVRDVYDFASLPVLAAAFEAAVAGLDTTQRYFVDLAFTRLLAGRGLTEAALREMDRLDGLHEELRQRCPYLPTTERHRARIHTGWARAQERVEP